MRVRIWLPMLRCKFTLGHGRCSCSTRVQAAAPAVTGTLSPTETVRHTHHSPSMLPSTISSSLRAGPYKAVSCFSRTCPRTQLLHQASVWRCRNNSTTTNAASNDFEVTEPSAASKRKRHGRKASKGVDASSEAPQATLPQDDGAPHFSVMLPEILRYLSDVRLHTYVDCTLGAGQQPNDFDACFDCTLCLRVGWL